MENVPASEIANRIIMLQALLLENGVDAAIIRQNADLFYFTGTVQDSHLIVPSSGEPVLLVRRSIERTEDSSPIRPVIRMRSLGELAQTVFDACSGGEPETIGLELDVMPVNTFSLYSKKIFPKQRIVDISGLIRRVRMIKSTWEIQMLRAAASISKLVAESVPALLKPGMSELELCAELESVSRKAGNYGMIRCRAFNMEMVFGHILSGPNGAIPSYTDAPTGGPGVSPAFGQGAGDRKILPGEIVSVDTMVIWNGYANDQTRNFSSARLHQGSSRLMNSCARCTAVSGPWRVRAPSRANSTRPYGSGREKPVGPEWFMGFSDPRITFVGARDWSRGGRVSLHCRTTETGASARDGFRFRTEDNNSGRRNCRT